MDSTVTYTNTRNLNIMKLSVVLVNHNNCALLEQSLNSLLSAVKDIESELFVVDNASTDRSRYYWVRYTSVAIQHGAFLWMGMLRLVHGEWVRKQE